MTQKVRQLQPEIRMYCCCYCFSLILKDDNRAVNFFADLVRRNKAAAAAKVSNSGREPDKDAAAENFNRHQTTRKRQKDTEVEVLAKKQKKNDSASGFREHCVCEATSKPNVCREKRVPAVQATGSGEVRASDRKEEAVAFLKEKLSSRKVFINKDHAAFKGRNFVSSNTQREPKAIATDKLGDSRKAAAVEFLQRAGAVPDASSRMVEPTVIPSGSRPSVPMATGSKVKPDTGARRTVVCGTKHSSSPVSSSGAKNFPPPKDRVVAQGKQIQVGVASRFKLIRANSAPSHQDDSSWTKINKYKLVKSTTDIQNDVKRISAIAVPKQQFLSTAEANKPTASKTDKMPFPESGRRVIASRYRLVKPSVDKKADNVQKVQVAKQNQESLDNIRQTEKKSLTGSHRRVVSSRYKLVKQSAQAPQPNKAPTPDEKRRTVVSKLKLEQSLKVSGMNQRRKVLKPSTTATTTDQQKKKPSSLVNQSPSKYKWTKPSVGDEPAATNLGCRQKSIHTKAAAVPRRPNTPTIPKLKTRHKIIRRTKTSPASSSVIASSKKPSTSETKHFVEKSAKTSKYKLVNERRKADERAKTLVSKNRFSLRRDNSQGQYRSTTGSRPPLVARSEDPKKEALLSWARVFESSLLKDFLGINRARNPAPTVFLQRIPDRSLFVSSVLFCVLLRTSIFARSG